MFRRASLYVSFVTITAAIPCFAVNDSLYFLFQRSTYLEQLTMPGAWWANPALITEIDAKTVMSVNVTPLGNIYTLASAKYILPVTSTFSAGVGILGAGISPGGSLQAGQSGVSYQSRSTFSNPSVQLAVGLKLPWGGALGVLGDVGAELLPDGYGGQSNFPIAGFGLGILSPWLFNHLSLSLSSMSTGHFWQQTYWNYDGKAGVRYKTADSLLIGSLEYTFSLFKDTISWLYQSDNHSYQVVKGMVSFKVYSIAGILLGYSSDLGNLSDNGNLLHLGAELRQSNVYPYFGGYEMGIALSSIHRNLLVHHFWVGYAFRERTGQQE